MPTDPFEPIALEASRQSLPATIRRVVETSAEIQAEPPERPDFLHAVLCQVGMPRRKCEGGIFERKSGNASIRLESGAIYNGQEWVSQPLPYGTHPRLIMVHISSEAVRTQSPHIEVGATLRQFLDRLGVYPNGGPRGGYTMFRKQMAALAACRMSLGIAHSHDHVAQITNANPIERFDAWIDNESNQQAFWPGYLELNPRFFETLSKCAVPLDPRALSALKHSSLAFDIYSWLAHRLCRVNKVGGIKISWVQIKEQFGQEYQSSKDFKKKFLGALRQVRSVYPDARLEVVPGSLILYPSLPPVPKIRVLIPGAPK